MEVSELKKQVERMINQMCETREHDEQFIGSVAEARQFIIDYSGQESSFFRMVQIVDPMNNDKLWATRTYINALKSLIRYKENGLDQIISPERQAQIDVVNDFLDQAQKLLSDKKIHPAAPAVLIGASLEEFLRNWTEDLGLINSISKPSIDTFTKLLKQEEQITKQDVKDITSWAGTRNDAAHGNWDDVSDRNRIKLMLEGVNLFIRKYSPED